MATFYVILQTLAIAFDVESSQRYAPSHPNITRLRYPNDQDYIGLKCKRLHTTCTDFGYRTDGTKGELWVIP